MNQKVNVLGQEYSIEFATAKENPYLSNHDGYCDSSTHRCVIDRMDKTDDPAQKEDIRAYRDVTVRHELVHAFLYESGLEMESWARNEETVDWIAIQLPKMAKAMIEAGALKEVELKNVINISPSVQIDGNKLSKALQEGLDSALRHY